jgi:hypothetical protein
MEGSGMTEREEAGQGIIMDQSYLPRAHVRGPPLSSKRCEGTPSEEKDELHRAFRASLL